MGGNIVAPTIMTHVDSMVQEPNTPNRTGYAFDRWYREAEYINTFDFSTETITENITLYAKWLIKSYQVSFNSNGGNAIEDTLIAEYNELIAEPAAPQRDGFLFEGWYKTDAFIRKWDFSTDRVVNNMNLIAKWTDEVSTVTAYEILKPEIYPNPANTLIHVDNLGHQALFEIFSLDGRLFLRKKLTSNKNVIPASTLSNGTYIVRISNNDWQLSEKIIIKH